MFLGMAAFLFAAFLRADEASSTILACVTDLHIPQYSALARNAGSAGTAEVKVRIEGGSQPPEVTITGVTADLRAMTAAALESSTFAAACANRELRFTFRFEQNAKAGGKSAPFLSFSPPGTFTIRTRPGALNVRE